VKLKSERQVFGSSAADLFLIFFAD